MDAQCDIYTVCKEKFKHADDRIDELKESIDKTNQRIEDVNTKLNTRIDEIGKKADNLENSLTNRLTQIETKFDIYNDMTCKKLDGLEKKLDDIANQGKQDKEPKRDSQDLFKEWITKKGLQLLDFAVYGGFLYAVAKGLKLF